MEDCCSICCSPIQTRVYFSCNHNNFCFKCFYSSFFIYKTNCCLFCQREYSEEELPIVSDIKFSSYSEGRKKNPKRHPAYPFLFLSNSVDSTIASFYKFKCPKCQLVIDSFDLFSQHSKIHKCRICKICYEAKRFLPCDCEVMDQRAYDEHINKVHPLCTCCSFRAFDMETLSLHCRNSHFRCDICAKIGKVVWLKDADQLILHNQKEHYICHHSDCQQNKLIAFESRLHLKVHLEKVHKEYIEVGLDEDSSPHVEQSNDDLKRVVSERLMKTLNSVFDESTVKLLKLEAKKLTNGEIDCNQFYKRISEICGSNLNSVFNDLIITIPVRQYRTELNRIHNYGIPPLPHSISEPVIVPPEEPVVPCPPIPKKGKKKKIIIEF